MDALAHPYLDEGRLRYHSCMCKCCYTTTNAMRQYTVDFEPVTQHTFDDLWEKKLTSIQQVKGIESVFIFNYVETKYFTQNFILFCIFFVLCYKQFFVTVLEDV